MQKAQKARDVDSQQQYIVVVSKLQFKFYGLVFY